MAFLASAAGIVATLGLLFQGPAATASELEEQRELFRQVYADVERGQWDALVKAHHYLGLRALVGALTFPIIREGVEDILLADDEAIVRAMRLVHEHTGAAIEHVHRLIEKQP